MTFDGTGRTVAQIAQDQARAEVAKLEALLERERTPAMTDTITREQVEALLQALQAGQDPFADGEVDAIALCQGYLAWLDVQPRPIEEAPDQYTDDPCLVWVDGRKDPDIRSGPDGAFWKQLKAEVEADGKRFHILGYTPITSLPKPKAAS